MSFDSAAMLTTVWNIALTIIVAMLPIVVPILAAKAASLLKISTTDARYQSLYRTIENVLKMLLVTKGSAAALQGVPLDLVTEALDLVKRNNPEQVANLAQTDEALTTKIIARLPEAQASVAESASRVAVAT